MAETYVHNGTEFKNAQQSYGNVSGTFQEVNAAYANVGGTFKLVFSAFQATSFVTLSSGTGTFTVPANANALHIQAAVGGGGGAAGGADYDKAGGESAGAGGGSGGYVSDKVFSLNAGDTLTFSIGSGGAAGNQTANFVTGFGENVIKSYIKLKNTEIDDFRKDESFNKERDITDWEKINTLDC